MDRISNLPDPIRSYIVSLLPMEDAFRTSVLSTDWRNICCCLSNLTFDQIDFEEKKFDFKDFVYQTLVRLDGSDVEKFDLSVEFDDSISSALHLIAWISFAARHNVKEINLSMVGELEKPPCCLFTCKTLTVLSMYGAQLSLPTNVRFPVLKRLSLQDVLFADANESNRLISSCPIVQDLIFQRCRWMIDTGTLMVSAPTLRILQLFFTIQSPRVKICVPGLNQITYFGEPADISLETLSSLRSAKVMYFPESVLKTGLASDYMSKILLGMSNVVSLYLDECSIELLVRDRDLLQNLPASCCSLKSLEFGILPIKTHVEVAIFLLKSCPNLEALRVNFHLLCGSIYEQKVEGCWQPSESSTEGTLNHLRNVKINCFGGNDCELDLVSHLLEKSNILEEMSFRYSPELAGDVANQKKINEKLVQFKKASASAKISYPPIDMAKLYRGATDDLTGLKILRKLMTRMKIKRNDPAEE